MRLERAVTSVNRPSAIRHQDDHCVLIAGDALELIPDLPGAGVDLIVTSPPYNLGKEYETKISLDEYTTWCANWMKQLYDVLTPTGSFWLNLGYVAVGSQGRAVPLAYLLWDKSPFFLVQEVVWHYGAGVAAKRAFSPRNEKFLWFVKDPDAYTFNLDAVRDPNVKYPNQKKNGKIKVNPLGKNPSDVWIVPKVTSGANRSSKERAPHPAQFPEAVIERIIRACSHSGDLVLDPFVGSGTTCAVAKREGRQSLGFDLRSDYLAHASRRLANVSQPLALPFVNGK